MGTSGEPTCQRALRGAVGDRVEPPPSTAISPSAGTTVALSIRPVCRRSASRSRYVGTRARDARSSPRKASFIQAWKLLHRLT